MTGSPWPPLSDQVSAMSDDIAPRPMVLEEFLPLVGKRFVAM
jgi:hypothetical protein